ncbi:hypothetical protein ABCR94_06595 [Streptomyces sp. 21So2-11]|uniref:hypothetical protein n=1 Tax=Streptomyces sp. 21So2-11 TaxID=3144408 RepID=UPI00321B056A
MAAEPERQAAAGKVGEAEVARDELARALRLAGIQFPAMDVKPAGCGENPSYALVELGRCSPPVARALAAVIAKGATK